jgi:hypothetical protein
MNEIFRVFSLSSTHLWRRGQGEEDFPAFHEPVAQFCSFGLDLNSYLQTPRTVKRRARARLTDFFGISQILRPARGQLVSQQEFFADDQNRQTIQGGFNPGLPRFGKRNGCD